MSGVHTNGQADTAEGAVVDLLGVGFGPAAIAVATAIDDAAENPKCELPELSAQFWERTSDAAWQPDMLLPGTDIQHHFLRDFATPRNPQSRFTFPNYLVRTGRFFPFTLMGGYVSRHEWSEYVSWVANQVTVPVQYETEVVSVEPVTHRNQVTAARVVGRNSRTGATTEQVTRNVLISTGHQPFVPDVFRPHVGDRVFHSAHYLRRLASLPAGSLGTVAVVGAGQNAGEILLHLASAFPDAQLHSIVRNSGFKMYNLGHFSNEAYFPAETDYFYRLDAAARRKVFDEVYTTNYACVDPDLSTALYRAAYEDHHWGPRRWHFHKRTEVHSCASRPDGGYLLGLREVNTAAADTLEVDAVIVCTGFREPRIPQLLHAFGEHIVLDEAGDPVLTRAFRLVLKPGNQVGLYLNGITEWRHGINSATSFSTMAVKAAEIFEDLHRRSLARPQGATCNGRMTVPAG